MKQLKINGQAYNIPSQWNELTYKQFAYLASLITDEIQVNEFKLKMLLYVSGLKVLPRKEVYQGENPDFVLAQKNKTFLISSQDLAFASNIFDFMFKTEKSKEKDGEPVKYLYSKLHVSLLKSFKRAGKIYHAPADALGNCLFAEYIHCETFYVNYCKTKDQIWLQKIMAVLYRPKKSRTKTDSENFDGDIRQPLNDFLIDKRTEIFSSVPIYIKNMVYLFYSGCHNYIQASFPDVFSGGSTSSKKKDDVFAGMMKLVNALANNDVTKNEQIRQSYLWEVMVTLNELALQRIDMEEKFKKTK